MIKIVKKACPPQKIGLKCPFSMVPSVIVIHNTANDASAANEIAYMHSNNNEVSFHFAVDENEAVQGIELDRNAWHAGDGRGKGNMQGIAIEICHSKSGGEKFRQAQENAAELTAQLLKQYGWGLDRVTKHQDYNGKHCPHRTLDEYSWKFFLELVKSYMSVESKPSDSEKPAKTLDEVAQEVIVGKWGNGDERKQKLKAAGFDYQKVQARVNELLGAPKKSPKPTKKSNNTIAKEVIAGKWGNGAERKTRLTAAGYDYKTIQALVNKMLK